MVKEKQYEAADFIIEYQSTQYQKEFQPSWRLIYWYTDYTKRIAGLFYSVGDCMQVARSMGVQNVHDIPIVEVDYAW